MSFFVRHATWPDVVIGFFPEKNDGLMFMPFALTEKPSSGWNLRLTLPETMV